MRVEQRSDRVGGERVVFFSTVVPFRFLLPYPLLSPESHPRDGGFGGVGFALAHPILLTLLH